MFQFLSQGRRHGSGGEAAASSDGSQQPFLNNADSSDGHAASPQEESPYEDIGKLRHACENFEVLYVDTCQRLARLEKAVLAGAMDAARELCNENPDSVAPTEPATLLSPTLRHALYEIASRPVAQSLPITHTHVASSDSSAQEVQTRSTVQFDSAVMYAEEGELLLVHIMRLGGWHSACSVDYETEDSERWGHKCEALKGTVHFKPGERTKTISLRFFEDDVYQGSTVEVSIRLSNPQGCVLGAYLKRVRVKLLDNDTFPTNKFAKDLKEDYSAESWKEGQDFSMFVEFCKFVFKQTTSGSIKMVVAGQVNNLIFVYGLWIMRVIVNALDHDDNPPSLVYVTVLALCLVLPFGLTHLIAYQSSGWGVGGGARKVLLEGLMSKFLYFEEKSRHKLNTYEWIAVFNTEVTTLVNDGYMQVFTLITAIGKVVLLALFMTSTAFTSYRFQHGEKGTFRQYRTIFHLAASHLLLSCIATAWCQ
ncbi:unnamed protein product [Prorocentrum cordatum]|uniref:Calx-beta domain-containing protein n=1 Tax=Prorocentrum cordatum TaxID=2364126 RepID=A0ABN9UW73_9DINO|nr:unnamed protein product [Polarella glacialis]